MAPTPAPNEAPLDVSRRQLMRRAGTVGLLMRTYVNLVVALVALADPNTLARPAGKWLLAALAGWSLYRALTRSHSVRLLAVDYAFVLAVCLFIPVLAPDQHFYAINTAPQAIAGTAVVSISVAVTPLASLPMTLGVAAAYASGAAAVVGWENLAPIAALYYFALQWATASLIRIMLLRVAAAVDRARGDRHAAELNQRVTDAVRESEREQLALLHDTAASTVLMVGQGASVAPQRLAAQARRDLDLLDDGPWAAPPPRIELVAALRACAKHTSTPVHFDGPPEVWLGGEIAKTVIAAAREAMNNVDRHARASRLCVTVSADTVRLEDDGVGFDPDSPRTGHGVSDSIVGRMHRAGGHAHVSSAPGSGTVTELFWAATPPRAQAVEAVSDPDRLIERIRVRYGLALTAYALANLAFTVSHAVMSRGHSMPDALLGVTAALCTVAAVPGIRCGRWHAAWPAAAALLAVTIVQAALLPAELIGGYAHWTQSSIGWCVLPLVLGLPTRTGAAVLLGYWVAGAAVELAYHSSPGVLVNLGLGSASILGVQLFALMFNGLMRGAAADAQAETQAHQLLITRDRVRQALRAEYRRRYSKLVDNVVPLLETLSLGGVLDDRLQRRARVESRRLRALFDQETTFDHPLMQRLRPLVDAAEARQVEVTVDVAGELPDLNPDEITAVVGPLERVLEADGTSLRLVVSCADEEFSVSVVCDVTSAISAVSKDLSGVDGVDVAASDDAVWFLIRHPLQKGDTEHALVV